ncbi:MAG TPA: hypothetical protein VGU61_10810 [Noviherbaspirillum sp.]|uniref:hypothetical protein n=1 Tax=Noviherbaspirillum sp. TaxID=1926288 RepID=UPI002DDD8C86|nr:hypothetical protein [Noviherbaspirillum sp.]HEV2610746.1 hypothetical protein [Noviherbaspirillum sp.]
MRTTVGTMQWAAVTNGLLTNRDRQRLLAQAMLTRAAALPDRLKSRLGIAPKALARIDLASLRIPDSGVARQAAGVMRGLSPPWLANHCMRTYLWGAICAQGRRIRFDEELLFVASALHDLGLTPRHACDTQCAVCFAVEGARAAARFALDAGWPDERRQRLSEAISLHLNVRVGLRHGAEAHLLHAGAAMDLVGAGIRRLHPDTVGQVVHAYPRLGFKENIVTAMKAQSQRSPQSRAGFLMGLGFAGMIRGAPLAD